MSKTYLIFLNDFEVASLCKASEKETLSAMHINGVGSSLSALGAAVATAA